MSTTVRGFLAKGRSVDVDSFTDLTPTPVSLVEWATDGQIEVTFDTDLTAAEIQAVRIRIVSDSADAEAARADLAKVINGADPTTATARLVRLEALIEALVRLLGER